jgi:transposase-like protein
MGCLDSVNSRVGRRPALRAAGGSRPARLELRAGVPNESDKRRAAHAPKRPPPACLADARRARPQIRKLRRRGYFPSLLEPRRLSEQALVSVVQDAYVGGVSTRKVDVVESVERRSAASAAITTSVGRTSGD